MSERNGELVKNSLAIGVGTMASKALSFLLVPLYSVWLSPEEYGLYDLLVSYITLGIPFVTLQLEQAVYRNCIEDQENARSYFSTSMCLVLPLLIIAACIVCAVTTATGLVYSLEFTLYFISLTLFTVLTEYVRGNRQLRLYSLINIVAGVIIFGSSLLLVGALGLGLRGVISAYPLAYFSCCLFILIRFKPIILDSFSLRRLSSMLRYSIPLIPNNIAWWITNVSNRTVISLTIGSYFNGLFAVCSKVPTIVSMLFGVFNLAFQQTAFVSIRDDDSKEYFTKIFGQLVNLLGSGCLAIVACVPFIYVQFIDRAYWDGMVCVPLLVAGTFLLCLAQYLGNLLLAEMRTNVIGISTILAALINVTVNFALIYQLGILAAAIASLLGYISMFGIRYYLVKKYIIGFKSLVRLFVWILLIIIVGESLSPASSRSLLGLVMICSLILFLVYNRNLIRSIVQKAFA